MVPHVMRLRFLDRLVGVELVAGIVLPRAIGSFALGGLLALGGLQVFGLI